MYFEHPQNPPTRSLVAFLLEPHIERDEGRQQENNLVFDEIIDPTVSAHDYRIFRSSQLCRADYVSRDHQRLAEEADLLIVNLSYYNPVVFYCLAWRLSRDPEAPVLTLQSQGHLRLIETPVLTTQPVLYDLSPPNPNLPESGRDDEWRGRVQNARRDLAKQFLILQNRAARQAAQQQAQQTPPPAQPQQSASDPFGTADSAAIRQAKDDILRHLMNCVQGGSGDIVDRLSNTLLKTPRF